MKYQFFKDTGIQFFGDPSIPTKIELNKDKVVDASNGKTNLEFSHRLLSGEWLPLAIDNRPQNLLSISFDPRAEQRHRFQ